MSCDTLLLNASHFSKQKLIYFLFLFNYRSGSKPVCAGTFGRIIGAASQSAPGSPKRSSIREYHEVTGDIICPSRVLGIDHLRDPRLNKGLAFTLEERQILGIHGLQPARFKSQEEQLELCKISIRRYQEDLNRYLYLTDLQVCPKLFLN